MKELNATITDVIVTKKISNLLSSAHENMDVLYL